MKLLEIVGLFACPIACVLIGVWIGAAITLRSEAAKTLRKSGLTRDGAKLLREAMRFINSLVTFTEFDGEFGETRLSDLARERAQELVSQYRKETAS